MTDLITAPVRALPMKGISMSVLCHNRADFVGQMLTMFENERRMLRTDNGFEVILVDDASNDPKLLDLYDIIVGEPHIRAGEHAGNIPDTGISCRVIYKDHDLQMPESWARNVTRGFAASHYDILWHWDDDTLISAPGGWAQKTADMLRNHPEVGSLAPYRTGIMEPFVPTPHGFELSFGLTEPCFALRRDTFDKLGAVDETLRWFYGPDYSLRMMVDLGLECAFHKHARQIDLFPRGGVPTDTFSRADGGPYYKKWCDRFGEGEHAWPPYVRHRERIAALPKKR